MNIFKKTIYEKLPLFGLFFTFLFLIPFESSAANCSYTISGRIQVAETETIGTEVARPLPEIKVRVRGKTPGGAWSASWGTVETNNDGDFELTKSKSCVRRYIQVSIKLDSARATVTDSLFNPLGNWTVVAESTNLLPNPNNHLDINVGARTFGWGSQISNYINTSVENHLDDSDNVKRAQLWYYNWKGMQYLGFNDFDQKILIGMPALPDEILDGTGFAVFNIVALSSSSAGAKTMLHELIHIYGYQNYTGVPLPCSSGTKPHDDPTCRRHAIHEGLAEWAAYKLWRDIWNHFIIDPFPYSRFYQRGLGQTQLSDYQIRDYGVQQVLNTLSLDGNIHLYLFNLEPPSELVNTTAYAHIVRLPDDNYECPDAPTFGVLEILDALKEHPDLGLDSLDFNTDPTLEEIIDRVELVTGKDVSLHKTMMDATLDNEPSDLCERVIEDQEYPDDPSHPQVKGSNNYWHSKGSNSDEKTGGLYWYSKGSDFDERTEVLKENPSHKTDCSTNRKSNLLKGTLELAPVRSKK